MDSVALQPVGPASGPRPPLIDRLIGYVSPRWAAERAAWRQAHATFRGGVATRVSTRWDTNTSFTFGTAAERRLLRSMRDRGRRVFEESAVGYGLLKTEVDNVVADGLNLQARTESKAFNAEAEDRWGRFLDGADVRGVRSGPQFQRDAYQQSRLDGDAAVVLSAQGDQSRLQLVPGDLVSNPNNGADTETVKAGVEVDRVGRPVAFHLQDVDGDTGKRAWTRARADNVVWLCHPPGPMHVRGMTCYARSFALLDQLDGYVDAAVIAARMAAVFGLVIRDGSAQKQLAGLPSLLNAAGDPQKAFTLENGQVKFVGKDGQVAQVQATHPMAQMPDFVRIILRLLGVGFDMPLELVLKDVSQSNLSSLRGGRMDYQRACRPRRAWYAWHWGRIYRWWVSREVSAGRFTTPAPEAYWPHEFHARGWEFTDPIVEAQAALLEIDAGINSPQNFMASLGRDPETITRQIAEFKAARDGRSLPWSRSTFTRDPMPAAGGPGLTPVPGSSAPAPAAGGTPDAA